MNKILSELKVKNQETIKMRSYFLLKINLLVLLFAIGLLIIDTNQFLTLSVLLIFFMLIMSMILLFIMLLNVTKNLNIRIKNSIDIIYNNSIRKFNDEQNASYTFKTENFPIDNWYLVPSYVQKDINYCLHNDDQSVKMYHAQTFTIAGNPQRRTIYFSGIYIIFKGVEGDIQYRDKNGISGNIINVLKAFNGEDLNDVNQYSNKIPYDTGYLYSRDIKERPNFLSALISFLKLNPMYHKTDVAIKNGELHIALEEKSINLPYVRKYSDEEALKIQNYVEEKTGLLKEIEKILSLR